MKAVGARNLLRNINIPLHEVQGYQNQRGQSKLIFDHQP